MARLLLIVNLLFSASAFAVQPTGDELAQPYSSPALHKLTGASGEAAVVWLPRGSLEDKPVWSSYLRPGTGFIGLAFGAPIRLFDKNSDVSSQAAACRAFILENGDALGVEGTDPELKLDRRVGRTRTLLFCLRANGVLIEGTRVVMTLNSDDELIALKARTVGSILDGGFTMARDEAVKTALAASERPSSLSSVERVYLPRGLAAEIVLTAAYRVDLRSVSPAYQPRFYIDAASGEILAAENLVQTIEISGACTGGYFPRYHRDDEEIGVFPDLEVKVDGEEIFGDEEGIFQAEVEENNSPYDVTAFLRGRWSDVQEFDAERARDSSRYEANGGDPIEAPIAWADRNSSSDERNLYFHVNAIHQRYKQIEPEFDGMDYPILSVCGVGGPGFEELEDNAFSSAQGIFFGRGNRADNFALYADVVYHEYSHSVTGRLYGNHNLPYEGESGALNEAWSDYFSCSFTDEPLMGEGGLLGNGFIRNIDNRLVYPRDIQGEVHADSRIISAAMWHTREILGERYSDSLFHFARYLYADEFRGYFLDVLSADDDNGDLTDGTPNYRTIFEQFGRHGIGLGDLPYYRLLDVVVSDSPDDGAEGDGNGLVEPGEIFAVNVTFFRAGLPADDADPVQVMLNSPSPDLEPVRWSCAVEGVGIGEGGSTDQPLLTRVSENAATQFVWLYVTISAGGEDHPSLDSLRITVGSPPVILIRDGGSSYDRSKYYTEALDSLGVVYTMLRKDRPFRPARSLLPLHPTAVWFSGDDSIGILDSSDCEALGEFLDGGGRLLLTGQYLAEGEGRADFLREKLGVRYAGDAVGTANYAEGVAGDPVGNRLSLLMQGDGGAGNQTRHPALEAVGNGAGCFRWTRAENRPAAAVRFESPDSTYRAIFFGFGLEAINRGGRTATRRQLLATCFNWLNAPLGAPPVEALPHDLSLSAYPNPFNGRATLSYSLPKAGTITLNVFDASGRLVERLVDGEARAGDHRVVWDAGGVASGWYHYRLTAEGEAIERKILLLK